MCPPSEVFFIFHFGIWFQPYTGNLNPIYKHGFAASAVSNFIILISGLADLARREAAPWGNGKSPEA